MVTEAKVPELLPGNRQFLLFEAMDRHQSCEAPDTCACHHHVTLERTVEP